MATLTREQIAALASSVGFTGKDIDIAVAVALAESGGNPQAHNKTPPDDSYGLWQINMLGSLGPDRRKRFGISSNSELFKPEVNAKAAYTVWKGSGWQAWTTYTRGTYKKYLKGDGANVPNAEPTSTNPILGLTQGLNAFGETVFKGAASFGGILVAVALIVIGLVILLRGQVANLAPTNAIVKTAKKVGAV